jgi:HEPN domain-containing protein
MNNNHEQKMIALQWLNYAEGDLKSAQTLNSKDDLPFRNACYLAQQSVEKSIKSLMILLGIEIIRTHDLDALIQRLSVECKAQFDKFDLSWLSEWNVEARYPGDWSEATRRDADLAVYIAENIYKLVLEMFPEI